jgi:hypothetical protein
MEPPAIIVSRFANQSDMLRLEHKPPVCKIGEMKLSQKPATG